MAYVVLPTFLVAVEKLDAFLAAARADADQSVSTEPGCLQFDVSIDRTCDPVRAIFYEVYADRVAFETHLETPHLIAFREKLHLCEEGPVKFFERLPP